MPQVLEYKDDDSTPIRTNSQGGTAAADSKVQGWILSGLVVGMTTVALVCFVMLTNSEGKRKKSEAELASLKSEFVVANQNAKVLTERLTNDASLRIKISDQVKSVQAALATKDTQAAKLMAEISSLKNDLVTANSSVSSLKSKLSGEPEVAPEEFVNAELKAIYTYDCSIKKTGKLVTGYEKHNVMGFALLISTECLAQNEKLAGQPLGCIEEELRTIVERLPEKHVKALQKVQIWVEWDHTIAGDRDSQPLAVYYGGVGESLLLKGIDPRKSRNITILTLKDIYKLKSTGKFPTTVLIHELAHAVHDFNIGFDNVFVDNAYRQARSRRLYEKVENRDGKKVVGYASSNSHEYFAELSTCYLDQIPYAPFDANGLREYDSIGYELMTKVWGTIEQIDKAKKDDVERKLKLKVKK